MIRQKEFALAFYCTLLQDSRRRNRPPKSIGQPFFLQCISNGRGPSFVAPRAPTHTLPVYDQSV